MMKPGAGLYASNGILTTALSTQAQVANRTVIAPWVPSYNMTIDQVGISVSTLLAASNCKVVIYAADADGRPSTVLLESANLSAAAAATVFVTVTALALTAGTTYWVGVRSSGTQTLRCLNVGAMRVLNYTNAATPVAQGSLILTETFANAAATWTYATAQHSTALAPLVLMRVA